MGRQIHQQIMTMEDDLCWNEGACKVPLNLQINAAQRGIGIQGDFVVAMNYEPFMKDE